jgi:site-specific recombinase XerD
MNAIGRNDKKTELKSTDEQGIIRVASMLDWCEGFILDRRAQEFSAGTIRFYQKKLSKFVNYCLKREVNEMESLTPRLIREYFLWLEEREEHTAGGIHAFYRALKAFLRWYETENELKGWVDSIFKVKIKPPQLDPLDPADIKAVEKMIAVAGTRDKAILMFMLDTGVRASELLALNLENVNTITGVVQVLHGKGGKFRTVYIGRRTRIALRKYLKERTDKNNALFINRYQERLLPTGLRQILRRLSKLANVEYQSPHSFRRLFAISMLRSGVDIYTLQLLMGHADIQVLKRYLKITQQDALQAHLKGSPVDTLLK